MRSISAISSRLARRGREGGDGRLEEEPGFEELAHRLAVRGG
jgi:hypothetical protein